MVLLILLTKGIGPGVLQPGNDAETRPLCTSAKWSPGDRVLSEVEKKSFIALPGKGGTQRSNALKTVCPNPEGFGEEFYNNGSRVGLLRRIRACAGPALL